MWPELVVWLACLAAVWDLAWRSIPRWLTVAGGLLGLAHAILAGSWLSSLSAAAAGLAFGVLLWQLDAVGGGDAKWLAALGALLGFRGLCFAVCLALIIAGITALVQLARQHRLRDLGGRVAGIILGWRVYGLQPNPEIRLGAPDAVAAPFAPALAIGIFCALWLL
ncbi:MAG: prepilin peptidase [Terriglobales bacterium]